MLLRGSSIVALLMTAILLCAGAVARGNPQDGAIAAQDAGSWNPDVFPISFWCGPPANFVTQDRFQQIAHAGFTYAMPPCGATTPEINQKILDYSQAAGIKAFILDGRMPHGLGANGEGKERIDAIVADYSKHPALAGYFIGDEPGAGAFPALGQTVAYLREKDPTHPAYLNLYPNYCPPHGLGTPTYEAYLEAFLSQVKPAILSYDHYHFLNKSDRPGFFSNLEDVRAAALKHKVPFWQIVLLINHFDYRTLTEAELRWEAMQTLAFGGKGLMYFTYWRPADTDMWGEAMIASDGTPTAKFAQVKRVNKDVQVIGRELLKATSIAAYEFGLPGDLTHTGGDQPFSMDAPNLTLGYFSKGGGQRLAMIANRDYRNPVATSVRIDSKGRPIEKLNRATGAWERADVIADSIDMKVKIELEAGAADLYRWSIEDPKARPAPVSDAAVEELEARGKS